MNLEDIEDILLKNPKKHPNCKGYKSRDTWWGSEFSCGYNSKLTCEECKYGTGRKDPEAACNQEKYDGD